MVNQVVGHLLQVITTLDRDTNAKQVSGVLDQGQGIDGRTGLAQRQPSLAEVAPYFGKERLELGHILEIPFQPDGLGLKLRKPGVRGRRIGETSLVARLGPRPASPN